MVPLEISPRHASWLKHCLDVTVQCRDSAPASRCHGRLRFRDRPTEQGGQSLPASVTFTDPTGEIEPGMIVDVTCRVPVSELEPFRSLPTDPPPLKPGEPRQLYSCPEHPDILEIKPGRCSVEGNDLMARPIAETQRIRWWCPMHPAVTRRSCRSAVQGMRRNDPQASDSVLPAAGQGPGGSRISGRRHRPSMTVVFIETMPGMFDGVEVVLGPRCGDSYPVVKGLESGQKVAVSGAFLLDAETRLNPSLASSYFGAGSIGQTGPPSSSVTVADNSDTHDALAKLQPADRRLAQKQRICPVTRKPLGSMGTPVRVVVADRVVFLCCSGCQEALEANPARYLAEFDAKPTP